MPVTTFEMDERTLTAVPALPRRISLRVAQLPG